jgi:N-terminal acetyltransferase B complex catalytic subunit
MVTLWVMVCDYCFISDISSTVMGKAEGRDEQWHGHVTAVTVAPQYRRLHLAAKMMKSLEDISDM